MLAFTVPGADDSQLFHAELKSRAIPQARGCTPWSGENPLCPFQGPQDMSTFAFFKSLVLPGNVRRGVWIARSRSGTCNTGPGDRMTARSITFWSSRMFPGQLQRVRACIVSEGK